MIQSNESMPCTVINTKQINSCETDGPGSAIKGQDAEELLSDASCLCSQFKILWLLGKNNLTSVFASSIVTDKQNVFLMRGDTLSDLLLTCHCNVLHLEMSLSGVEWCCYSEVVLMCVSV